MGRSGNKSHINTDFVAFSRLCLLDFSSGAFMILNCLFYLETYNWRDGHCLLIVHFLFCQRNELRFSLTYGERKSYILNGYACPCERDVYIRLYVFDSM